MYSPTLGRFISTDPVGFDAGDENLYGYVGNSPTGYVDPTGTNRYATGSAGAVAGGSKNPFVAFIHSTLIVDNWVRRPDGTYVQDGYVVIQHGAADQGLINNLGILSSFCIIGPGGMVPVKFESVQEMPDGGRYTFVIASTPEQDIALIEGLRRTYPDGQDWFHAIISNCNHFALRHMYDGMTPPEPPRVMDKFEFMSLPPIIELAPPPFIPIPSKHDVIMRPVTPPPPAPPEIPLLSKFDIIQEEQRGPRGRR